MRAIRGSSLGTNPGAGYCLAMTRAAAVAGMVVLATLGCSCTKITTPLRGTVAGFAEPCSGSGVIPGKAPPTFPPITVFAWRDGKLFASARTPTKGDSRYRLSLPPGTYVFSAPGAGSGPKTATVRPGQTITVNFPNFCA